MMYTIHKFILNPNTNNPIQMTRAAIVLSAQMQHGNICMWVSFHMAADKLTRNFRVRATGEQFTSHGKYISTVQDGGTVYHIFEVTE